MGLCPNPSSLISSSSNFLETPLFSLFLLPRLLSTSPTTTSSSAADFWQLLRSNRSRPNLERTLTQSKPNLNPSIVDSVLRGVSSTDRSVALRFFVWAGLQPNYRHSAAAYGAACDSLQISRHPHTLDHLLNSYRSDGSPVSVKCFKILLNICREANLPDQALSLLRRMGEFGCRPDTFSYNAVLRLLLKSSGHAGVAMGLMEEMAFAGLLPDMVTYVSMVRGLSDAGWFEGAKSLVERMRVHGCVPNVVVYSALLDGACRSGNLDAAVALLGEMEMETDERCSPNVVTYTCLIKCVCEEGRLEEALGVLDRMGRRGCCPNRVTVSTLVKGFCTEGRVDEAYKLIEKVVGDGGVSSKECYSLLVACLSRIGDGEGAEGLVRRMLAMAIRPDGLACNSLLRELCSKGRFLDGNGWLYEMEEGTVYVDSDVYSVLLAGLCKEGHLVEAAKLVERISERGIWLEAACVDGAVEVLKKFGEDELVAQVMRLKRS